MNVGPEQVIREDVREGAAYAVASAEGRVKLDAMENPYSLPEALQREIAELIGGAALNRYPDPRAPALRARLRQVMRVPDRYELLLGNGSDEIIHLLVQAVARPGAVVMAPSPTFVMYKVYAGFASLRFVAVPLARDFSLDRDAFLAAVREARPALVFLSYPNNPSGNLFDDAAMAAIIEAAPGLVVIDEAYHPFAQQSWMPRLGEFRNLLVLRTVSKLGLAGLRLGFLVGRPEWIREIDKLRSPYNVGVLTQLVAERLLAHDDVLEAQAAALRADRDALARSLGALPGVTVFPSRANFVLVRLPGATAVFGRLRQRGVLVKSMHGSDPLLADCLRLTVGTTAENRILLDALRESLR